jgi:hypothetical protein
MNDAEKPLIALLGERRSRTKTESSWMRAAPKGPLAFALGDRDIPMPISRLTVGQIVFNHILHAGGAR